MMRPRPVGLRAVAESAGVSRMTASYALRNFPKISAATRSKVQAAAKRLGYVPDARVAALMGSVRAAKNREPVPIAWLNTDWNENAWHRLAWLSPYFAGAAARCQELGYRLEEVWLREPRMTHRRMSDILYCRGIKGVLIAPPTTVAVARINLNWERFASVSLDKGITVPCLHGVAPDYFYNMLLALKTLRRLGYRRIGVCLTQQTERRSLHAYLGAVGYFHSIVAHAERLPVLCLKWKDEHPTRSSTFFDWLDSNRPDAIVCQHDKMIEWLSLKQIQVPRDVGVVHLAVEDDVRNWSGIWQRKREIGAGAVELVTSMLKDHLLGLPAFGYDRVIRGRWNPGQTVRTVM